MLPELWRGLVLALKLSGSGALPPEEGQKEKNPYLSPWRGRGEEEGVLTRSLFPLFIR